MRLHRTFWLAVLLIAACAGMANRFIDLAGGAVMPQPKIAQQQGTQKVDVLLVLAVDVSFSIDVDELKLQREGYAGALVSNEFLNALKEGANGRIAIAYFEWAAGNDQRIIVPWRIVDGAETAAQVAAEILNASLRRAARTSISGAIAFGRNLIDTSGMSAIRRVIDISGDGPNNNGEPVTMARDAAIAAGIVINGLPVMIKPPTSGFGIENLDQYYEDCVIGGPGAFVVPVQSRDAFIRAIRTKLVQEVAARPIRACRTPPPRRRASRA